MLNYMVLPWYTKKVRTTRGRNKLLLLPQFFLEDAIAAPCSAGAPPMQPDEYRDKKN
jgi:hypothetical protein